MAELKKVMFVEDDADIRNILQFSLETIGGYRVCACAGGLQAIEQAPGFQPELVLLDVMMPGLTGPQTLARLRTLECMIGVPMVFLTAKAFAHEVEALLAHGATDVIVKPFDAVVLPQQVRQIWERSLGQ